MRDHNSVCLDAKEIHNQNQTLTDHHPAEKAALTSTATIHTPVKRTASMTRVVHQSSVRRHLGIGRKSADKKGTPSKLKLGVGVWSPMKEQLKLSQLCLESTGTGGTRPPKTLFFLRGVVSLYHCVFGVLSLISLLANTPLLGHVVRMPITLRIMPL